MSTLILNSNDTIILTDSIVAKVMKMTNDCQTYINGAVTNTEDVEIVKYICFAFVLVVFIAAITIYLCYRKKINAEQKQKDFDNKFREAQFDKNCKELEKKNEELKKQNEELKKQNEELKKNKTNSNEK